MDINALDMQAFATTAVNEVFETMLSMDIAFFEADPHVRLESNKVVGSESFAGNIVGLISIHMSEPFARVVTATLLGMEDDEIEGQDDVHDVAGEMTNVIGGNLK